MNHSVEILNLTEGRSSRNLVKCTGQLVPVKLIRPGGCHELSGLLLPRDEIGASTFLLLLFFLVLCVQDSGTSYQVDT